MKKKSKKRVHALFFLLIWDSIQIFCNICDSIKFKCDNPFRENAVTLQRGVIPECRAAPPKTKECLLCFMVMPVMGVKECFLWGYRRHWNEVKKALAQVIEGIPVFSPVNHRSQITVFLS